MGERRYPLEPILRLTGWTHVRVQQIAPCNGTEWRLRRQEGVTERIADRLAVAAGLHPATVWDGWADDVVFDRACQAHGCDERFIPRTSQHTFCSPRCRRRAKARRYRSTEAGAENNRKWRRSWYEDCREYDNAQSTKRRALMRRAA